MKNRNSNGKKHKLLKIFSLIIFLLLILSILFNIIFYFKTKNKMYPILFILLSFDIFLIFNFIQINTNINYQNFKYNNQNIKHNNQYYKGNIFSKSLIRFIFLVLSLNALSLALLFGFKYLSFNLNFFLVIILSLILFILLFRIFELIKNFYSKNESNIESYNASNNAVNNENNTESNFNDNKIK